MRRNIVIGILLLFSVGLGTFVFRQASAQSEKVDLDSFENQRPDAVLLTEDFTYTAGSLLSANNWTAYSAAGTNALATSAPGLTYTGYAGSGIGNAVSMATSGEDASRSYAPQSSGSVYASVLVNLSEASVDPAGGYFFHIGADPVGTAFRCRTYAKKDASNNVSFGISKASTVAGEITFTPFSYALNTTHLLVVKYTIVAGDTNDTCDLFVNPALGGAEPAATAVATDLAIADIVPGTVSLRQGTAATAPTVRVDGIRIGTAWADIAGGGSPSPTPTPSPSPSPSASPSPSPTVDPSALPKRLFTTRLTGAQEVPAVTTNGRGFGRVVLNAAETEITASFYWEGLSSGTISGHIHGPAAAGVNAPILFNMNPTTGVTSGSTIDRTFTVTPAQVADLRAGLWYFNIHTTNNTGGEIRGQLRSNTNDAPLDFNGDGKTDFGVVRSTPAVGGTQARWYNLINDTNGAENQVDFGVTSDSITPGDFDGDGKDDIAVWRSATDNSFFIILQSSTNTVRYVRFGIPNDDPFLIADYDGDGIDDPAIFRKGATDGAQSQFWWFGSYGITKGVQVVVNWGVGADTAAPGDYNGDGKADFLVNRTVGTRAVMFIHYGTGGFDAASPNDTQTRFGLTSDLIVPGDYDGDGKTDIAVSRAEGAALAWYFLPSAGGAIQRLAWGRSSGDSEVQGDYDGDGKTDYAVWRSSAGNPGVFFILRSSNQTVQYQNWGLFGDAPTAQDSH